MCKCGSASAPIKQATKTNMYLKMPMAFKYLENRHLS
jgi:hypothetical protein